MSYPKLVNELRLLGWKVEEANNLAIDYDNRIVTLNNTNNGLVLQAMKVIQHTYSKVSIKKNTIPKFLWSSYTDRDGINEWINHALTKYQPEDLIPLWGQLNYNTHVVIGLLDKLKS